ncbi:prepilin-type N-terminal cleavage/methylation domain-containing protein [Deinococcus wulumuqiensis]|uniref:Prepilin-type N-terminal cleavage/methylation domain-containing protein n=1 Tax=Deinococcus wulumuqiensis TaxID=980427 RepID=A0AAV4K687_9DEIO|nr:prepilin-type N-terminal cleavage/methylation domain-containing protein [Deinococcus wulumuqiensis]QII22478.1 prepilin-type N-terminal cleavage/methylation domain-containing protein [Deinococcus wulumuqiensis R12]GGI87880.1 hypothetical protein GCM10010914_22830 [Deinococcus wulumuqiensis]GGP30290.1 hypothetical protein GCM10008021_19410 [Deinococcus wulumuqiensis]
MKKHGFTLIEILIGLALMTLVFATVTVLITRSAQAGRQSSVQAAANTSVTKLGEQLGRDLSSGQVILQAAGQRRLDLLRLGARTPLTLAEGASRKNTSRLTVKGNPLAALSGKPVVVVSSTGDYLLTRVAQVTPAGANSEVVFSCLVSLPGNLSVYPFTALSLEETASGLRRTEEGAAQIVGSNVQKVRFEPVYGTVTGVFYPTPMNPVSHHAGERLSAVNYALTSGGEHPITSAGTARLSLVGLRERGCNENPAAPANNLGKLQVNVLYKGGTTGPAGVTPGVGVSGPSTSSNINTWTRQTFENLDAGTYSVSAPSLTSGERIYDATVTGNPATVGNGKQGTVNVNYLVRKGKITLDISGLPSPPPASGAVRFSGPENLSVPAQNGTPQVELTPGDYAVTADPIGEYEPEISTPNLHVTSSTNDTITVTYGIPKGSVNLQITGLPTPPPATGYVQVTGPESKTIAAQSGTTSLTLKRGEYTVTADQVGEYEPSISSSTVTVGKNTSTTVTVSYAIPSGPLALTVQGLPAGNSAALSVSGPVSQTVTVASGTTQTVNLQQGNYTITAPEVTVGGTKYLPSPASGTVSLGKGGAGHTVTYAADAGNTGNGPGGNGGNMGNPPTTTLKKGEAMLTVNYDSQSLDALERFWSLNARGQALWDYSQVESPRPLSTTPGIPAYGSFSILVRSETPYALGVPSTVSTERCKQPDEGSNGEVVCTRLGQDFSPQLSYGSGFLSMTVSPEKYQGFTKETLEALAGGSLFMLKDQSVGVINLTFNGFGSTGGGAQCAPDEVWDTFNKTCTKRWF